MHSVFAFIIVKVFILCAIRGYVMHWLVFMYWYVFEVWCSRFQCNQSHLCVDYRASQSCKYPLLAGNCPYPNIVIYVKWYDPKIIMVMGWWRVKGHQGPEHNYLTHWETTDRYLENSHTFHKYCLIDIWYMQLVFHMLILSGNTVLSHKTEIYQTSEDIIAWVAPDPNENKQLPMHAFTKDQSSWGMSHTCCPLCRQVMAPGHINSDKPTIWWHTT